MKKREEWIDASRGLLIVLVVAGHAFGAASHVDSDLAIRNVQSNIYKVIYFFHMTAFFLLAGITWSDGGKGFVAYFLKKFRRLMLPYLIFGLLSMVVEYVWAGNIDWLRFVSGEGCRVNAPLWFLPCMFFVEIMYWLINRYGLSGVALTLMLVVIGFMARYYSLNYICRFITFLFFMLIGNKFLPLNSWGDAARVNKRVSVGLFLCFFIVGYFVPWEAECSNAYWLLYRIVAFVGSILIFMLCRALPNRVLCYCGIVSLYILALHKFPLVFAQSAMKPLYKASGSWAVLLTSIITLTCVVICIGAAGVCRFMLTSLRRLKLRRG